MKLKTLGPLWGERACFRGLEYVLFEILDWRPLKQPAGELSPLCTTWILNDRKMRPLCSSFYNIRFHGKLPDLKEKNHFSRWPSEMLANQCRPISHGGQMGRQCLAGISEGHRGNLKIFAPLVPYTYYGLLGIWITEVAFFYHSKFKSYIVIHIFTIHRNISSYSTLL